MNETPCWQPMTQNDLNAVNTIAALVHQDYPEDPVVFAERLKIAPSGCYVLKNSTQTIGYIISHAWFFKQPPALNSLLGSLPKNPDTYYIHDLALLPEARGAGWGKEIVKILCAHAKKLSLSNLSLVAVNKSLPFWNHKGFEVFNDSALMEKLRSYDHDACFMVKQL